jgi:hypothetical protein
VSAGRSRFIRGRGVVCHGKVATHLAGLQAVQLHHFLRRVQLRLRHVVLGLSGLRERGSRRYCRGGVQSVWHVCDNQGQGWTFMTG